MPATNTKSSPTDADGVAPIEVLELRERIAQLQGRWDKRERTRFYRKILLDMGQKAIRENDTLKRRVVSLKKKVARLELSVIGLKGYAK